MAKESDNEICAECGMRRAAHTLTVYGEETEVAGHPFTTRVGKSDSIGRLELCMICRVPYEHHTLAKAGHEFRLLTVVSAPKEPEPRTFQEALDATPAHRQMTYADYKREGLLLDNSGPNLPDMLTEEEIQRFIRVHGYSGVNDGLFWNQPVFSPEANHLLSVGGHVVPKDLPFADLSRLAVLETLGPDNPIHYRARLELKDLYVVWSVKVLQNWKTLVSTDKMDGVYFEVTYNGDKGEAYVDQYLKARNTAVKIADGKPAAV